MNFDLPACLYVKHFGTRYVPVSLPRFLSASRFLRHAASLPSLALVAALHAAALRLGAVLAPSHPRMFSQRQPEFSPQRVRRIAGTGADGLRTCPAGRAMFAPGQSFEERRQVSPVGDDDSAGCCLQGGRGASGRARCANEDLGRRSERIVVQHGGLH